MIVFHNLGKGSTALIDLVARQIANADATQTGNRRILRKVRWVKKQF